MIDYRSKLLLERYDAPQVRLLYAISHDVDYHGIKKEVAISKISERILYDNICDFINSLKNKKKYIIGPTNNEMDIDGCIWKFYLTNAEINKLKSTGFLENSRKNCDCCKSEHYVTIYTNYFCNINMPYFIDNFVILEKNY